MPELIAILVTALLLGTSAIVVYRIYSRNRRNEAAQEKIKEHKEAMLERFITETDVKKYSPLDYTVFREHKDALIARIRDEDWFEKFISLLFVRSGRSSIAQAFLQKASRQSYELTDVLSLSALQPILLIGDAGSGKTTTLHKIAVDLCGQEEEIPLLLNLALYYPSDDLVDLMNTERKLGKEEILQVFTHGRATLLVDQLNELKDGQEQALDALSKLMSQYKGNRYIIAVRTSGYLRIRNKTEGYIAIEVEPLNINKINSFLRGYLGREKSEALIAGMDNRLRGLCSNPLMLSMVASVYESTNALASNKSELYEQFLYQLLHNWDQKTRHSVLAAYIDEVLAFLSYRLNPSVTAHPLTLVQSIVAQCIAQLNSKYVQNYTTQLVTDVLQVIAVTRVDRFSYMLFFIHQSIQEFYAAHYIVGSLKDGSLKLRDIEDKLLNNDWIEPIFFICGLLDDASDLIHRLIDLRRYYFAAQCVQNSKMVDSSLVDELIVYTLTEFKYSDESGEPEAVPYDLIRGLRLIADRKSSALSKRIVDDVNFFLTKYSIVSGFHTIIPPDEMTDQELISLIANHENSALEGDYLRTLGHRKAKSAIQLVKELATRTDYTYRDDAIWALGEVGQRDDTNVLIDCLNGTQPPQIVVAACNALIRAFKRQNKEDETDTINVELATEKLIEYIENLANPNREAAGWALSQIAGDSVKDVYIKHVSTGANHYPRAMFVWLTGLLGIRDAIDKLVSMYPSESEGHVREDIVFALGDLAKLEQIARASSSENASSLESLISDTKTKDSPVDNATLTSKDDENIPLVLDPSSITTDFVPRRLTEQPTSASVTEDFGSVEISEDKSKTFSGFQMTSIQSEIMEAKPDSLLEQPPLSETSDSVQPNAEDLLKPSLIHDPTKVEPAPTDDKSSDQSIRGGTMSSLNDITYVALPSNVNAESESNLETSENQVSENDDIAEATNSDQILAAVISNDKVRLSGVVDPPPLEDMRSADHKEESRYEKIIATFVVALNDEDAVVRMQAVMALQKLDDPKLSIYIASIQSDPVRFVRETVTNALAVLAVTDSTDLYSMSYEAKTMITMVEFLIEIGRWAKNELSERWKLRRKQQEMDISVQESVQDLGPSILRDLNLDRGEAEVQEIMQLIRRKRDAIIRAQNMKLADKEELDSEKLSKAAYEIRTHDNNKVIREMLIDIQHDLEKLGFNVSKEQIQ